MEPYIMYDYRLIFDVEDTLERGLFIECVLGVDLNLLTLFFHVFTENDHGPITLFRSGSTFMENVLQFDTYLEKIKLEIVEYEEIMGFHFDFNLLLNPDYQERINHIKSGCSVLLDEVFKNSGIYRGDLFEWKHNLALPHKLTSLNICYHSSYGDVKCSDKIVAGHVISKANNLDSNSKMILSINKEGTSHKFIPTTSSWHQYSAVKNICSNHELLFQDIEGVNNVDIFNKKHINLINQRIRLAELFKFDHNLNRLKSKRTNIDAIEQELTNQIKLNILHHSPDDRSFNIVVPLIENPKIITSSMIHMAGYSFTISILKNKNQPFLLLSFKEKNHARHIFKEQWLLDPIKINSLLFFLIFFSNPGVNGDDTLSIKNKNLNLPQFFKIISDLLNEWPYYGFSYKNIEGLPGLNDLYSSNIIRTTKSFNNKSNIHVFNERFIYPNFHEVIEKHIFYSAFPLIIEKLVENEIFLSKNDLTNIQTQLISKIVKK